jgi:hypothetical protein
LTCWLLLLLAHPSSSRGGEDGDEADSSLDSRCFFFIKDPDAETLLRFLSG